jgi:hypothetical protein
MAHSSELIIRAVSDSISLLRGKVGLFQPGSRLVGHPGSRTRGWLRTNRRLKPFAV